MFSYNRKKASKTAYSKNGNTTLRNSVCLCSKCNRLQGTDSWERFQKKQATAKEQGSIKVSKPRTRKPVKKNQRSNNIFDIGFKAKKIKSMWD